MRIIAEDVAKEHPPLWTPLPREIRELQALVRRLDALIGMQTEERNLHRPGSYAGRPAEQSIAAVLHHLEQQVQQVRHQIRTHMDQHPGLTRPGATVYVFRQFRQATAALLLAELFNKPFTSARQAAAFAGTVPRPNDSGLHQGRRVMCKVGPSRVRKGLYFPAIAAIRFNPSLQPLARQRCWQTGDAHHWRRHAETHSPGLRGTQIGSCVRCHPREGLTVNRFSCFL